MLSVLLWIFCIFLFPPPHSFMLKFLPGIPSPFVINHVKFVIGVTSTDWNCYWAVEVGLKSTGTVSQDTVPLGQDMLPVLAQTWCQGQYNQVMPAWATFYLILTHSPIQTGTASLQGSTVAELVNTGWHPCASKSCAKDVENRLGLHS